MESLGVDLTKYVQDLYDKNHKTLMNETWANHILPCFTYCAPQVLCFLQTEVCGHPTEHKSVHTIFPTAFSHSLSLFTFWKFSQYLKLFCYDYSGYGDL